MATYCKILRTNRTLGKKKVKDKKDDFNFEGGLYFIQREKVFLDKKRGIFRTKIRPSLLYIENVSEPLYLDNFKLKPFYEDVPILDEKGKPEIDKTTGKIKTEKKKVFKLIDIFIDARAIHNMVDKKILDVLSATEEFGIKEYLLVILMFICIAVGIVNVFV